MFQKNFVQMIFLILGNDYVVLLATLSKTISLAVRPAHCPWNTHEIERLIVFTTKHLPNQIEPHADFESRTDPKQERRRVWLQEQLQPTRSPTTEIC